MVRKGHGFDPLTLGNETGYIIGCIIWNSKRNWVGAYHRFCDQFSLTKNSYFGSRTGARIAKRRYKAECHYHKKIRDKVRIVLAIKPKFY